ncbi:hypothetical protein Poli38472_011701 [Pythium oligandrum]|uniref:ATP synthase subunit O, mitochondrial n=1 Tax=Pythium oligandrum TaxID=41045 RepID=A0A8K1C815_PYTOL|nr:hypothetical protein Poli38472_011701 [Pythium oligandrum]|eukprot:TMW58113.1 hypothetical protein Poli38472_011701 [Pythium oligandrum]
MDAYRQTLLGRSLADVLQTLEREQQLRPEQSDAIFELFDQVLREEFAAAEPKPKKRSRTNPSDTTSPPSPSPPLFTHQTLQLHGKVQSFNRFMDQWTLHAEIPADGVALDGQVHEQEASDLLLKLHKMLSSSIKNARRVAPQATRTYAKAASSAEEVAELGGFGSMTQPKLQLFGIHARYANALYSVAAKQNKLDAVEKELLSIEETINKEPNFASFLKDPTIARGSKKEDISKVMEQGKFSKPVAGLFEVLAENGRLPEALGVISSYKQLMSAFRGEVKAKVTSADPLSKAQLDQVKKALGNRIKKDEVLLLETVVDPEILGGLKVQIGNYFIDLSLATKIDKINHLLQNTSQ